MSGGRRPHRSRRIRYGRASRPEARSWRPGELAIVAHLATSRKAVASLILGLCALVVCCFRIPPVILLAGCIGIPALVFGILGLRDINNPKELVTGKRTAITAIALGCLPIVVALLHPLAAQGLEPPRREECLYHLKHIGLAMHDYHDANGCRPPAAITDRNGKPLLSWRAPCFRFSNQAHFMRNSISMSRGQPPQQTTR
jgi:hypothetical protein